jgi:putative membrane protein
MEVPMMGPGWEMTSGGWLWMGLWTIAIVVMIWFITRSPQPGNRAQEPLEILRVRFARGEISQAEYEQARHLIDEEKEHRS